MRRVPIFAVCLVLIGASDLTAQTPGADRVVLNQPIEATLPVVGRRTPIRGQIAAWTYGAFWVLPPGEDTWLRVEWEQVQTSTLFRIMRHVLEREDAQGYLLLGIELLRMEEPRLADRAFRIARAADPSVVDKVERAIELSARGEDPIGAIRQATPGDDEAESAPGGSEADTEPGDDARTLALQRTELLTEPFEIIESERFVLVAQQGDFDAGAFARSVERLHDRFHEALRVDPGVADGRHRFVYYLITDRDDFDQMKKRLGGGDSPVSFGKHAAGISELGFHYPDARSIARDSLVFREIARSVLARHRSNRSLPLWAEEGLIAHVFRTFMESTQDADRLLKSVREYCEYNNVAVFMRRSVEGFDARSGVSYAVSHALVEYLIRHNPDAFVRWVSEVKDGADWEQAMEDCFEADVFTIGQSFEASLGANR